MISHSWKSATLQGQLPLYHEYILEIYGIDLLVIYVTIRPTGRIIRIRNEFGPTPAPP